ncbi:MAG: c-type cytochrome, partial [Longimicrobiales bacterium]
LGSAGACTPLDDALASVPFFKFMRRTQSVGAYEAPRPAPANAVPFQSPGGRPEPAVEPTQASLDAFAASPYGRNPLAPGEALELGQTMFERYCMVCHGADGQGNGPVVGQGKFPMGPTLVGLTAPGRSDGYIYAVIKAGRSLMPPYGGRTTPHERWAIVNYVRELQRAAGASPPPTDTTTAADTTTATAPAAQPGDTAATGTANDTTASALASSR